MIDFGALMLMLGVGVLGTAVTIMLIIWVSYTVIWRSVRRGIMEANRTTTAAVQPTGGWTLSKPSIREYLGL
jgi:hypothetical protein